MNILITTSHYPYSKKPKKDTPATVAYFAREWVKQGHCVHVVVNTTVFPFIYYFIARIFKRIIIKKYNVTQDAIFNKSWNKRFDFEDDGVIVHNFPIIKFFPSGKFTKFHLKRQTKKIKKELEISQFVPNIITGHWINPQLFLNVELKKIYKCKTAFVFEGDFWPEYLRKYNITKYASLIDVFGCRSKYASIQLKRHLNLEYNPFVCVSGIPEEIISKPKDFLTSDDLSIITAGRLVGLKHFDSVIMACKNLAGINYFLTIVGDGPLMNELKKLSNEEHLSQRVSFTGKIAREQLIEKMNENDVFVLISDHEAFGIVYLEAMSQGCIVIASRNGGIDGILIDGVNGFLCNEADENELSIVLDRIFRLSTIEKRQISDAAVSTAKKWTNENAAISYLEDILYEKK